MYLRIRTHIHSDTDMHAPVHAHMLLSKFWKKMCIYIYMCVCVCDVMCWWKEKKIKQKFSVSCHFPNDGRVACESSVIHIYIHFTSSQGNPVSQDLDWHHHIPVFYRCWPDPFVNYVFLIVTMIFCPRGWYNPHDSLRILIRSCDVEFVIFEEPVKLTTFQRNLLVHFEKIKATFMWSAYFSGVIDCMAKVNVALLPIIWLCNV